LKRLRTNNQIRVPEVQVIDEKGKSQGVMKIAEALVLARSKGLDLVEVNPTIRPSITKIMDYGKHLYKKAKSDRKHKSSQKAGELKAVRFAYRTGKHDLEFKAKRIDKFLKKGYKIKIDMIIKGREKSHQEIIKKRLDIFLALIQEEYKFEQNPKRGPRGLSFIISRK
jgi:translation initiation factor IF-3